MRDKLKGIVFVNQTFSMGGAENFNSQLLSWFRKKKIPIKAYVNLKPFGKNLKKAGIKTFKIPFVVDIIGDWKGFVKGIVLLPFAILYYAKVVFENRKSGVIYTSGYIEKILLTPWARFFNVPIVWIEHGPLETVLSKFLGFPRLLYLAASSLPDRLVIPSRFTMVSNKKFIGIPKEKVSIIGIGVNSLRPSNLAFQKHSVFCVSRMEKGKGQDILISAWPAVLERFPDAKLYFIGEGDFLPELKRQVSSLGIGTSVHFLGWVKDVSKVISKYSLGVFPSVWPLEGFGVVLLEAMSLKKPIVCFKYGPYPEVVDTSCAIMAKKGDLKNLSWAIIKVLQDHKLAKSLGENGKKRFESLFTIKKIGPKYEEVFLHAYWDTLIRQSKSRWRIYLFDLTHKGLQKFILDRLKKRKMLRKIYSYFRRDYVILGRDTLYLNKMDTIIADELLTKGVWEPTITKIFKRFAKKSRVIVDLGANIGYYTLIGSRMIKKGGKIFSFEPASYAFEYLRKNVEANNLKNVTLVKMAVSSKKGKAKIYSVEDNFGASGLTRSDFSYKKEDTVITTLDDYFFDKKVMIDLMKIDIEGYELNALQGARKLLEAKRIKVIISELMPEAIRLSGGRWQDYIGMLRSFGFEIFQIDDEKGKIYPFSEDYITEKYTIERSLTTNILAKLKE